LNYHGCVQNYDTLGLQVLFRATAKITTTTKPNCLPGNFSEKSFAWKGSKKSRKKIIFSNQNTIF
jgi:hypothetical protein